MKIWLTKIHIWIYKYTLTKITNSNQNYELKSNSNRPGARRRSTQIGTQTQIKCSARKLRGHVPLKLKSIARRESSAATSRSNSNQMPIYAEYRNFLKDYLEEMEAGAQKCSRKGTPEKGPKSGPKTGSPLGSPGAREINKFKGVEAFWHLRGVQFWAHFGPIWAQFRDPRIRSCSVF